VLAANAAAAVLRRYDAELDFLARIERYQREGPPPAAERTSREEIRAQYGV
jgi:hypothetical protein